MCASVASESVKTESKKAKKGERKVARDKKERTLGHKKGVKRDEPIDLLMFISSEFDAEAWADKIFQDGGQERGRTASALIAAQQEAVAEEMRKSVYENHVKFLETSKVVQRLDADIESVRESTHASVTQVAHAAESTSTGSSDMAAVAAVLDSAAATQTVVRTEREPAVVRERERSVMELLELPAQLDAALMRRDLTAAAALMKGLKKKLEDDAVLRRALEGTELKADIDQRGTALVEALVVDAKRASATAFPELTKTALTLLCELGLSTLAETSFLTACGARLQERTTGTHGVQFEGDVLRFIGAMSGTFFAEMASILREALTYFTGPAATSRVADWAAREIIRLCQFLRRRVLFSETSETVKAATDLILFHCKSLLPQGFDLSFVVHQMFPDDS